MVEKGTAFFEWDIDDVAIQADTWVCSPCKFMLKGDDQVGFSLEFRVNVDKNHFSFSHPKVRVRKDDGRLASATIDVDLTIVNPLFQSRGYVDRSGNSFTSSQYPFIVCKPSSDSLVRKKIDNWKNTCIIDNIPSISVQNNQTATIRDIWYFKNTTVRCNIIWHGFNELPETTEHLNLQECSETCKQLNFHRFFKSNEFHDLIIVVGDTELPAHKIILSKRSPVLYKMITADMKESKENRIVINNFTVEGIRELLEYFYTNKTKASSDVDVAMTMIEVAEMYQIDDLKEICKNTLLKNITINNVLNILCAAVGFDAPELRKQSIDFMVQNQTKVIDLEDFQSFGET